MSIALEQPSPVHDEPIGPYPQRYWWLKRLAALVVLIFLALAGVRLWWGTVMERRMSSAIAAVHGRGEKILVSDYARSLHLPDERNAAFYLGRAEKRIKLSNTQQWAIDNASVLPMRDYIFELVDVALAENAAALADIREARRHQRADWGVTVVSPVWSVLLPHLNPARQVALLTRAAALHAAQRGDHAAALEYVRDVRAVGHSLGDDNMFLITHLVQVGIDAVAIDAAGTIAVHLQIAGDASGSPATTTAAARPASEEQVRELIALLLDDGPRQASLREGLQGERAAQLDIGTGIGQRARLVRPSIQADVLQLVREGEQILAAAAAPDWPAAQQLVPNPPKVNGPRRAAHVVSESIRPALKRAVLTSLRPQAASRLAATALAIRLYQHDHGGQRPPTLEALVPRYLPAVPRDPFITGGTPIKYLPDGPRPYLYSVNENGVDDTATGWRPDATSINPRAPDLYLDLAPQAPPEPDTDPPEELNAPTTQPSE